MIIGLVSIGLLVAACVLLLVFGFCSCFPLVAAATNDCEEAPDREENPVAYERWRRKCEEREKRAPLTQWGGQGIKLLALKS